MHGEDSPEAFGRWLRELRGEETTQAALARRLGLSQSVVSNAEQGTMTAPTAQCYDHYFSAEGKTAEGSIIARRNRLEDQRVRDAQQPCRHTDLAALARGGGGVVLVMPLPGEPRLSELLTGVSGGRTLSLPDGPYQVITSTGKVVDVPIDRRLFVAGTGLAVPTTVLEQTRHGLLGSLIADRSAADVDEWQEIAREYGLSYLSTSPAELLRSLQVDITALGDALQRKHTNPAKRELQKVAALLAAFTALTVANLGDLRSSRRWWRTAKQAADTSGDIQARLWVRGGEVMGAIHEQRPVPVILDLVADAEAINVSTKAPPGALPRLLAGKARTLILAGQAARAETALGEARDNFDHLPPHITHDTESWFGWSEHSLHFTESFVYSQMGDLCRADQAQTAALALFPAAQLGGRAMIGLQRTLCLVRTGDITTGVEHAHAVMTGLPAEHHRRPVVDLGRKVLDAVPVAERGRDGVQAFRAYLGREVA